MTTWTCRSALLAGALLSLSACDDLPAVGLLDGLMAPASGTAVALSQTQMADGSFTLVPPAGFCIDRNTLRQNFALMARCDTLGAARLAGGAPLGLITISVTALEQGAPMPTPQSVADAAKLARFDAEKSESDAVTFRAEGVPPGAGLDVIHWRGLAQVGTHVIGIAYYGPAGGRVVTAEGRDVVNSLIRKTKAAS